MKNKHTGTSAIQSLVRKGAEVDQSKKVLIIQMDSLGNGSLGKLDYLVRVHKWLYRLV